MQEENSTSWPFGQRLKAWGKASFGSMKTLAERLDISPPHLSAYISGARKPTLDTLQQFRTLGADLNFLIDGNSTDRVTLGESPSSGNQGDEDLAIHAAQATLGVPLELLAPQLHATAAEVRSWVAHKTSPNERQLRALFNVLAIAALGGAAARVSSPRSLPADRVLKQGNER